VGISRQSNPDVYGNPGRFIPHTVFAPLAALPGVQLISLQKGVGPEQLPSCGFADRIQDLGGRFDAGPDAVLDPAAVMASLDLVITSDTAIAHLAGALGRPVWVGLWCYPDWRWLMAQEDTPWYPGMRLSWQGREGDWDDVAQRMTTGLIRQALICRPAQSSFATSPRFGGGGVILEHRQRGKSL